MTALTHTDVNGYKTEQHFNAKLQFSFGDPTFNTRQSGPPAFLSSDPFMGDGGGLLALLGDVPACLTPGCRTAKRMIPPLLFDTIPAVCSRLEVNLQ